MALQAGARSGLHRGSDGSDSASWAPPPTPSFDDALDDGQQPLRIERRGHHGAGAGLDAQHVPGRRVLRERSARHEVMPFTRGERLDD